MSRTELLEKTVSKLSQLPEQELNEVSDFAEFLLAKIQKIILSDEVTKLNLSSNAYKFLEDDKNIYNVSDLKEKYGK